MSNASNSPLTPAEPSKPRQPTTSLNLLLPNFDRSSKYFNLPKTDNALTKELERLTAVGIKLYNERRFVELAQSGLISPNLIKVNQDGNVRNSDFKGHMVDHKAIVAENPEFQSRIVDIAVDADECKGLGTTFALLEVTGYPSTLCRQTISVVKWKRNGEGQWQIANVANMRGAQGFA
ncbi:hypothetical protein CB0940_05619 [Cercospora beticola]|uniref:SnoaL-like domain-containing protein n=1 Tax=Cercospora beticola TaxID=122368 RepID=A0A2G5HY78_CERBT|nr:hypothetical protein CB0940_05619 [Cercospora beticola]PIA97470.1 hypothetical protein CB0940_05619 [Cercospora beticola]WPA98186.1 hypothetical protein RHO25_002797 [Cercospora beticola]CAK1359408.1 unnamed protein product [Cercospora beticola]